MKDKALLLFQFGPVQGFIAQAETAQDLWAGSDLLSKLTEAALKALPEDAEVVFPAKRKGPGLPNRVLAFVPRETATETARAMADALRTALREMAESALKVHPEWSHDGTFLLQVKAFPQTSWAILEEPSGDMGQDYKTIGALLAARRNTREFDAWPEEATKYPKDILSGKETVLDKKLGFGAMNLIKRLHAEEAPFDDPVKQDDYVAVLMMDGDTMGKRLSAFKTEAEHQAFSELLLNFAPKAEARIKDYQGQSIYVGGDDVLAVLPAHLAVACAKALAADFSAQIGGTASAGVAIGHKSVPLQELVNRAREAEHRAKEAYGRNALALAIHKRSGEILWWGSKWKYKQDGEAWDACGLDLFDAFAQCGKDVAGRFPYKLAALLQPYGLKGELPSDLADLILAETTFAIERTDGMKGKLDMAKLATFLKMECKTRAEDFLGLFLSVAFLWRQGEDK